MNGTHRVLTYPDDLNLVDDDIRTVEGNAVVLLSVHKDIGLAVNTRKTKCMEVGRHRSMMANMHITIGSNPYGKVKTFKYLDSLLTNENSIHEEINCRIKTGNSCCYLI